MLEFWERDDDLRDGAFATLRRESPITYFEVAEFPGFAADADHWALTRFDDIHHASRHPEIFSSIPTKHIAQRSAPEIAEFAGSMIKKPRRPASPSATQDRQSRRHAQGDGPHRGQCSRQGAQDRDGPDR
jgi:cytochrome P450